MAAKAPNPPFGLCAREGLPETARTSEPALSVLLVEDSPGDARLARELLAEVPGEPFRLVCAPTLAGARGELAARRFDAVLLDLELPDSSGPETVSAIEEFAAGAPIVVLAGSSEEQSALAALQAGAQDYLLKGRITSDALGRVLRYAVERHRHERGQRFLSEAGRVLSSSLDYAATLQLVAQLAVPAIGDLCLVDVVGPGDTIQRVAVAAAGPLDGLDTEPLRGSFELPRASAHSVPWVLETGRSALLTTLDGPLERLLPFRPTSGEGAARALLSTVQPQAQIIVPLVARGRILGCVSLIWTVASGRTYTPQDLRVAEQLAERAALAVDNARLYGEAKAALQARDDVLRFVSHDLKRPLTSMRLQTELLLDDLDENLAIDQRLQGGLRRIEGLTSRMTELVGELLDATCLQADQPLVLRRAACDLAALTRRVVAERQGADPHHIEVHTPSPPVVGNWDAARLRRVLDNLVSNAVKYSAASGRIAVSVTTERHGRAAWAVLSVRDAGIGIPAWDLPHVFDLFYRASNVPEHIGGSGIGLAGVRQVVEAHGGTIQVESRAGEGSLFTVRLPVQ